MRQGKKVAAGMMAAQLTKLRGSQEAGPKAIFLHAADPQARAELTHHTQFETLAKFPFPRYARDLPIVGR